MNLLPQVLLQGVTHKLQPRTLKSSDWRSMKETPLDAEESFKGWRRFENNIVGLISCMCFERISSAQNRVVSLDLTLGFCGCSKIAEIVKACLRRISSQGALLKQVLFPNDVRSAAARATWRLVVPGKAFHGIQRSNETTRRTQTRL